MRKKVTLSDIASQLNLSVSTVCRVLNNKGRFTAEVRQLVLKTALETGYLFSGSPLHSLSDTNRIAVIFPRNDMFWKDVERGICIASNALSRFGITIETYRTEGHNLTQQIQLLEDFLKRSDIAGIALVPADFTQLDYYINTLFLRGTAVVTFNVDSPMSKRLFYVGQNNIQGGRVAGEIFCKILGKKSRGKILVLSSNKKAPSHLGRWQGLIDYVEDNEMALDVSEVYEVGDEETTYQCVRDIILNKQGFLGVFMTTAFGNKGVGRALEEVGKNGLVIVSNDVTDEWIPYVEKGLIDFCLFQDPFLQGYLALHALAGYVFMGKQPKQQTMYLPIILYTKECLENSGVGVGESLIQKLSWIEEKREESVATKVARVSRKTQTQ